MGIRLNESDPLVNTKDHLINIYHSTEYNCKDECSNNSCCEGQDARITAFSLAMGAVVPSVPFILGMTCSDNSDIDMIQKIAGAGLGFSVAHLALLCYLRFKSLSCHTVDSRFPERYDVTRKMISGHKCTYDANICFTVTSMAATITSLVLPLFTCPKTNQI